MVVEGAERVLLLEQKRQLQEALEFGPSAQVAGRGLTPEEQEAISGAWAEQNANYYFQGESQNTPRTHTFNGPMSDNWQVTDTPDGVAHGPCKDRKPLTIEAGFFRFYRLR